MPVLLAIRSRCAAAADKSQDIDNVLHLQHFVHFLQLNNGPRRQGLQTPLDQAPVAVILKCPPMLACVGHDVRSVERLVGSCKVEVGLGEELLEDLRQVARGVLGQG